jgi:phospholipase/lecithinase/hemolysin
MSLKMKKVFVAWCLSVLLVFAVAGGAQAYSSVLAFGDSLSDNGTSATDPYGIQRFTNDKVWVEYLAGNLNASLFDMAIGGAQTGTGNIFGVANTGLLSQVGMFQINPYLGTIADNTLVTISAGGNDMFGGLNPLTAADNIKTAITSLIGLGGDSFLVMNLSPNGQSATAAYWMSLFNERLLSNLRGLNTNPDVDIFLLDLSTFAATGLDHYDGSYLGQYAPGYCPSWTTAESCYGVGTGTYAWWDAAGIHPTSEVHKQMAALPWTAVPEPASIILLFLGFAGLVGTRRRMK